MLLAIDKKICQHCHKEYDGRGEKYCSRLCDDLAHQMTKICIGCGSQFTRIIGEAKRQEYCSMQCYYTARRLKSVQMCLYCGNKIEKRYPSNKKKFCSYECRDKYKIKTHIVVTEEILRNLIYNKKLNSEEIAKELNLTYGQVWKHIKYYKLKLPKGAPGQKQLFKDGLHKCPGCKQILTLDEFNGTINDTSRSLHQWYCHKCRNERSSKRRDTFNGRLHFLFSAAQIRSKKRNLSFNITKEDISNLITKQQMRCYYTDIEMTLEANKFNTISLDRIDSTKGYELTNIVLCCDAINTMKMDMSVDQFIYLCQMVANKNKQALVPSNGTA